MAVAMCLERRVPFLPNFFLFPLTLTLRDPRECKVADGTNVVSAEMAYTVKQVAAMSGVSVRTLHFYDETGLLKPAYHGANSYRFYEEPQLLTLQQILFYRELGFELKEIKRILDRPDFQNVAALESHRQVLEKNLTRTRSLIETIDKTIQHLKGTKKMKNEKYLLASASRRGTTDSAST